MRFRWTRWLPGFPAVLLMPAIVVTWASLLWAPEGDTCWEGGGLGPEWGFPIVFARYDAVQVRKTDPRSGLARRIRSTRLSEFRVSHFLIDLAIVLAAAYILTMAADRLLFPAIRGARRRSRGSGETG